MSVSNDKIEKYLKLAKKKPQYYAKLGDLYSDEGDFKTATIYYQKAVDNGVLAYTVLERSETFSPSLEANFFKSFDTLTLIDSCFDPHFGQYDALSLISSPQLVQYFIKIPRFVNNYA